MSEPPAAALSRDGITRNDITSRNNVTVSGNPEGPAIVFVHGFGLSGQSWRYIAPQFESTHTVVVFDLVGAGQSDISGYDRGKYDSLHGYTDDLLEIIEVLGLSSVTIVAHSVSGIMGILAANRRPDLVGRLVLIGPSARYIDDDGYHGGFTRQGVDELLDSLDSNYVGWSSFMGSTLMGNPERPELAEGLSEVMVAMDPAIVRQFARVTFLSDNRRDLADVRVPTLILQSSEDVVADFEVGTYVHEHIAGSSFVVMGTRGHVPILSSPDEVAGHIKAFLA